MDEASPGQVRRPILIRVTREEYQFLRERAPRRDGRRGRPGGLSEFCAAILRDAIARMRAG